MQCAIARGGQGHCDSCNRGHHEFLGIEQEVTGQIAQWMGRLKQ